MSELNQLPCLSMGRRHSLDIERPMLDQQDLHNQEALHADQQVQ